MGRIDFFQTFSPAVGFDVMRMPLATAAHRAWDIGLLAFTQAYLNVSLREDIWLELLSVRVVKAKNSVYD